MFSKARVGDEIFSMRDGPVRIVEINHSHTNYPIRVKYGSCLAPDTRWITLDGKQHGSDRMATYYWAKPEVIAPPQPLPVELAVDTPIFVRNGSYGSWYKRHFAGFENGIVMTWPDGMTSFSIENEDIIPVGWDEWKLPEEVF